MKRADLFRDPPPLPPHAPEYSSPQAARDYAKQQAAAKQRMALFDSLPYELRREFDTRGGSFGQMQAAWFMLEDLA